MRSGISIVLHTSVSNSQYRAKHDMTNPVLAGCLVGAFLARNQGPLAVAGGCAGFAGFSAAIELYLHRETESDD